MPAVSYLGLYTCLFRPGPPGEQTFWHHHHQPLPYGSATFKVALPNVLPVNRDKKASCALSNPSKWVVRVLMVPSAIHLGILSQKASMLLS